MITTELIINTVNALTGRVQVQPEPLFPMAVPPRPIIQEAIKDEQEDDGVPDLTPEVEDDDVSDDETDDAEDDEEQTEVETLQPQLTR